MNEWTAWIIAIAHKAEARLAAQWPTGKFGDPGVTWAGHEVTFEEASAALEFELVETSNIGGQLTQCRMADRAVERIVSER